MERQLPPALATQAPPDEAPQCRGLAPSLAFCSRAPVAGTACEAVQLSDGRTLDDAARSASKRPHGGFDAFKVGSKNSCGAIAASAPQKSVTSAAVRLRDAAAHSKATRLPAVR